MDKVEVEIVNKPEFVGSKRRAQSRILTMDEIEEKMMELASEDTNDPLKVMINEKKLAMFEKVANFKIHRLQLKELEKQTQQVTETQPITVKFIGSKTEDQVSRLERIDKEIQEKRGQTPNA